jgi:hypothetical protein
VSFNAQQMNQNGITNSKLQRSVIFIETSQAKQLAPAERHIKNQSKDYRLQKLKYHQS